MHCSRKRRHSDRHGFASRCGRGRADDGQESAADDGISRREDAIDRRLRPSATAAAQSPPLDLLVAPGPAGLRLAHGLVVTGALILVV
jgi:hypothetical protein